MSQWYYAANGAQQGPVSIEQLNAWARAGQFGPDVSVWRDGMSQWTSAGQVSELAAAFGGEPTQAVVAQPRYAAAAGPPLQYEAPGQEALFVSPRAIELLRQTKPWVRLFSVLLFIAVGLAVLGNVVQLVALIALASSTGEAAAFAGLGIVGMALTIGVVLLYLFPAMYLGRYASRIDAVVRFRRQADFEAALEAQKSYWKFFGVLFLAVVALFVVFILVMMIGVGVASGGF